MALTQSQQDIQLQKLVILATGSAANTVQLAALNGMVSPSGGFGSVDAVVDSYINQLVATQGSVATYQAIAKNGFGVTLSGAQAQSIINEFAAAGINTGSKLLNLLSNVKNSNAATLDNRAEAASDFIATLAAAGKSANFTGEGVTNAVHNLLQNIGPAKTSLNNGKSGLHALSDNLSSTEISGTITGYLANATVFADSNRDGTLNSGEWTTQSSAHGKFGLPNSATDGKIVAFGGTDLMTGNTFKGVLSASTGATVINPVTTVLEAMVTSGVANTMLEATAAIKAVLGLPVTVNLLSYNPLAVLSSSTATAAEKAIALSVQAISQQISNIITHTANVIDNATAGATLQSAGAAVALSIAKAIAAADTAGIILDLSNAATIGGIVQATSTATGSTLTSAQVAQIASITAGSNASAAAATDYTMLAQASDVAQGGATNALIAGALSGNFNNAVSGFTGTALTIANYDVLVGDIAPGVPSLPTVRQVAGTAAGNLPPVPTPVVPPTAPTGVVITTIGGTVVPNTLNNTNTNLTAVATIVAGEATGGSAVLKIGAITVATDATILAGDTTVTFNLNTANNAALQAAVVAGGIVTVTLTNAAGGSAVSTLSNPTLSVDYLGTLTDLTVAITENLLGTAGNDTFSGSYGNGAGPYTFNTGDVIDGLGGIDTLNITTGAEASTPPDGLWLNKTNFEKVIFNSIGNGAQVITTGAAFAAAFATGVNLSATTLLGAIDITMTTYTGATTITTITTGSGAHTITTGSGVSTVSATGIAAGAQTVNGVGLTTVNATINGAGDQIIGTTNGGNLVTVNATILAAGSQTIASTSNSNVTIVAKAASGAQTITTAGGNDSVTSTGAAISSATISTGGGNDVIIASLGSDLITGGTGADTMTGGGGVDRFNFGADGSIVGTSMDIITDFNSAGADVLAFAAAVALPGIDITLAVAGVNVQTSAGGLITFAAGDNTLALKVAAIQADVQLDLLANTAALFVDSGNTYVYFTGALAGNAIDDQMVQLTGITTLTALTGGVTMSIV